jgi:hypothetical protein
MDVLTDSEIRAVIMAFAHGRGTGVTDVETQCVVNWAVEVRAKHLLLEAIIEGKLLVDWKNEEVVFKPAGV